MNESFNRRRVLKSFGVAGASYTATSLLAGCGDGNLIGANPLVTAATTVHSELTAKASVGSSITAVNNITAVSTGSQITISASSVYSTSPETMFATIGNANFSTSWTLPRTPVIGGPPNGTWSGTQTGLIPGLYHTTIWWGPNYSNALYGPDVTVQPSIQSVSAISSGTQITISANVLFGDPLQVAFATLFNADYTQSWTLPSTLVQGTVPNGTWSGTQTGLAPGVYHTRVWLGTGYTNALNGPDVVVGTPVTNATYHNGNPVTFPVTVVPVGGVIYNVGPGQQYPDLQTVPVLTMPQGSVINLFYRATPYNTLLYFSNVGTAVKPYTLNGVTDAVGNRPKLYGANARYTNDVVSAKPIALSRNDSSSLQGNGLVTFFNTYAAPPAYWTIKNIDFAQQAINYTYTKLDGTIANYNGGGALYAVVCKNLTVENCLFHDSTNGLFVNSQDGFGTEPATLTVSVRQSDNVVVRNNRFWDNGVVGNYGYHSSYVASCKVLYEGNYYGPIKAGSQGGQLKDRSSDAVIRGNYINAINRGLDLVDEQGGEGIRNDPNYNIAHIYGNTIVFLNSQCQNALHFGGDSGLLTKYRKGPFYFYNNTYVAIGDTNYNRFSWFDCSEDVNVTVIARDNVYLTVGTFIESFWSAAGGKITLEGKNYKNSAVSANLFVYSLVPTQITDNSTGTITSGGLFNAIYQPKVGSTTIGAGTANQAYMTGFLKSQQYSGNNSVSSRGVSTSLDLGAYGGTWP
jgi:hypothetical protein